VLEEVIRPIIHKMTSLMDKKYAQKLDRECLILNSLCILSLGLYFNFARQIVTCLTDNNYDRDFLVRLQKHLVDFVLFGLEGDTDSQDRIIKGQGE
jgi:hypothetical protein